MRSIAIVNQKGGCGKTTTAINLAAFLARAGRRTLLVDMDPQGHTTLGLVRDADGVPATISDVFTARLDGRAASLRDVMLSVSAHLDLVPSNIRLSAVPEISSSVVRRERLLADLVAAERERYDYLIVDCPPSVGMLTFNALMACTEAIVPIEPGFFSLHGVAKLLETLDALARDANHVITPRALMTFYCGRTQFAREVREEIRHHLEGRCFQTVIRHSVKLAEAASHALPIAEYCRHCVGFDDYAQLCAEVLEAEEWMLSPRVTDDGVVFSFDAPGAHSVHLAGDFNGWEIGGCEMQPWGRHWKSVVKLDPGRYRYRYVVDGEWQNDPLNADVEPAPFGGYNSVVVVQERRTDGEGLEGGSIDG
jgi:cellulose biosynthesis protein BcsQ